MSLAKSLKSEVGFASNHGTMPNRHTGVFQFEASVWQGWVKSVLQK